MKVESIETQKISRRYCDICKIHSGISQCKCCSKDLCEGCRVYEPCDHDYCDSYCEKCWNVGKPFREEIAKLITEHDLRIENLKAEWFKKAKEELKW